MTDRIAQPSIAATYHQDCDAQGCWTGLDAVLTVENSALIGAAISRNELTASGTFVFGAIELLSVKEGFEQWQRDGDDGSSPPLSS